MGFSNVLDSNPTSRMHNLSPNINSRHTVMDRDVEFSNVLDPNPTSRMHNLSSNNNSRNNDLRNDQSLKGILNNLYENAGGIDPGLDAVATYTDSWVNNITSKLSIQDNHLSRVDRTVSSINSSVESAKVLFQGLSIEFSSIKRVMSSHKDTLEKIDQRCSYLEIGLDNVRKDMNDKFSTFQQWFDDMRHQSDAPVPREIVNSIQEVINDSAPGLAVESMRGEVRQLRKTISADKHVTEGLRNLVVGLAEQVERSAVVSLSAPGPGSNLHSSSSEGVIREREIVRKGIERLEKQVNQLILVDVSSEIVDISLIKKCKTVDVPGIHSAVGHIQKSLQKYVNFQGMDEQYCDHINDLLDRADTWCRKVEELYNKAEVHSINSSRGDATDVGVFSDNSKVTIYEFLELAELAYLGWGNSVQKANRLYNKHLSEEIKGKLINKSDSYQDMKQWLILHYGGASRIVNDIVSNLSLKPKPEFGSIGDKYSYYAAITSALQRLEKLAKVSSINKLELDTCMYSNSTVSSLSRLLLHRDHNAWVREMTKRDLDFKNPTGYDAFLCFKQICIQERNTNEVSRAEKMNSSPKNKNKYKSAHKIQQIDGSSSEDEAPASSHATNFHNKQWYPANLKFPCPLGSHKHEMSMCTEFFSLNPTERWNKMDKGKLCYCCLQPKNICTPKKCPNEGSVPATLKCDECKTWASTKGLAPFNILFCRNKEHSTTRAAFNILKKDMEKYIGKFGTTIVDSSIKFSVNYMYQIHSLAPGSANAVGWGQNLKYLEPAPVIDTETGSRIRASDVTVVPEIQEHSSYLMQTIRIGEAVVLVFFDRGANIHIIDGALATEQNLQLISSKPTALTVVGGKKIKTDYGTFRFNLGPGEDDKYHEIVCAGMDSVTAGFGKYDLSEICKEYRENAEPKDKDVILPPSAGGNQVQLLLGIKNTHLDPVLIKVLPSGVGVYLSPFKDVWGSRIIFAGPHHVFTQGNLGVRNEVSHAVFLLRDRMENDFREEEEIRPYSLTTDKVLGTTIHPYAFSEEDLLDAGGEVPEQFESKVESNLEQLQIMYEPDHYCSIHSANDVFLAHNQLRVERSSEAEVELEDTNGMGLHQIGLDPEQGSEPVLENASILKSFITHNEFSPSVFALSVARGSAELIVDPVFLGWRRALRVISYVKATSKILNHRKHLISISSCEICKLEEDKWKPNEDETGAEDVLFRYETSVIKTTVKKSALQRFLEKDGIIYADGRLSAEFQFKTEELDDVKFIDKHEIMDDIPVVLSDYPILYSHAVYIHTLVNPHAGVESTMKEIHKKMRVLSDLRNLIKKMNKDCLKCRLREKRTAELRMSSHPLSRTVLAPPFHSAMMDIAYGFKGQAYKRARSVIKIYARNYSLLIPDTTGEKTWGEKRTFSKVDMVGEITGFRHKIATRRDRHCMNKYLDNVSHNELNIPKFGNRADYLPVGAPLLDYLTEDVRNSEGWMYPKLDDLMSFQSHRGLSWSMTQEIEVRELICGISSEGEIKEVVEWIQLKFDQDQERFGSRVISLDVEDVKTTYHDTLRMAGKVQIDAPGTLLQKKPSKENLVKYGADEYRQIPGNIMFGNGITWMAVNSLDMHTNKDGIYFLEQMSVQQGILELVRNLPVSAGLGIRRDVRGIEEFYSLLADEPVVLSNGFLDLSSLSIAAGYKFHARNMTALGVQVIGTLLNKTGDKLCQVAPKYAKLWTRLLGAWPSIMHGSCRYLIQCREWLLVQIRVLARANIQWTDGRVIRVPTEADLEYARFGLSSDQIGFQSWTEPVVGARGFSRPGSISVPLIEFDPSVVTNTRIGRLCTGIQRFQRWTILEWGRMNPFRLKFFFTRMIRNSGFRIFYKGIYDALRLMFLWIFGEPAPVVARLDEELNDGVEKTYVEEKNALDRCEIETAIRRDRVSWMGWVDLRDLMYPGLCFSRDFLLFSRRAVFRTSVATD